MGYKEQNSIFVNTLFRMIVAGDEETNSRGELNGCLLHFYLVINSQFRQFEILEIHYVVETAKCSHTEKKKSWKTLKKRQMSSWTDLGEEAETSQRADDTVSLRWSSSFPSRLQVGGWQERILTER